MKHETLWFSKGEEKGSESQAPLQDPQSLMEGLQELKVMFLGFSLPFRGEFKVTCCLSCSRHFGSYAPTPAPPHTHTHAP